MGKKLRFYSFQSNEESKNFNKILKMPQGYFILPPYLIIGAVCIVSRSYLNDFFTILSKNVLKMR
jgi:hypothetical protein